MNNIFFLFLNGLLVISALFIFSLLLNKITKTQSVFKNISIILIALTTAYALIISSFSSYLLILFVFLIYAVFRSIFYKTSESSYFQSQKIKIIKEFALILFYFVVSFFLLNIQIIAQSSSYIDLQPDFSFYAGISEILSSSGIENIKIDLALSQQKSFTFYHYFELWFNGLLSEMFSITHLKSLMFITLPVLSAIMLKGLFELQQSIFSKYSVFKTNWKYLLPLSIFFLFPFTMTFRWLLSLGSSFHPWNSSLALWMSIKWILVLCALVYLFLDYKKNRLKNIVFIAGFMCVVYPTTMIATLPGLIIWILLFRKKIPKIAHLDALIITSTILAVMWYVNNFNQHLDLTSDFDVPSTLSMVKNYFLQDKSNLLLFIKEPVLRTLYIAVGFIPLFVFIYFRRKTIKKIVLTHSTLFALFTVIYLVSIFGVVLLDFSKDGDQIHRNIFYPLYILIFYIGFIYFIKDKNRKISISASVFLICTLLLNIFGLISVIVTTPNIDTKNYNTIIENLNSFDGESAYIVDSTYFSNEYNKNFYFEIPGRNIRFRATKYFPHLLSIDRIKIESTRDKFYVGYIYDSAKYFKSIIEDKKTYKQVFIEDDNLKFLIIHKNAPELENAEKVFDVSYLGEIEDFIFFQNKQN
jgi:hypothetical protein